MREILLVLQADDDGIVRLQDGEEGRHGDVGVPLAPPRQEAACLREPWVDI